MSWMTKKRLMPDWKAEAKDAEVDGDDEKANKAFKGGETDIGDAGFVVSFHVYEENKVKVEQFVKTQKMPFLPHHMVDVWPFYFEDEAKKVDKDKFSVEKVYAGWKVQTRSAMLNKWIKTVDPEYFKEFERRHMKHE